MAEVVDSQVNAGGPVINDKHVSLLQLLGNDVVTRELFKYLPGKDCQTMRLVCRGLDKFAAKYACEKSLVSFGHDDREKSKLRGFTAFLKRNPGFPTSGLMLGYRDISNPVLPRLFNLRGPGIDTLYLNVQNSCEDFVKRTLERDLPDLKKLAIFEIKSLGVYTSSNYEGTLNMTDIWIKEDNRSRLPSIEDRLEKSNNPEHDYLNGIYTIFRATKTLKSLYLDGCESTHFVLRKMADNGKFNNLLELRIWEDLEKFTPAMAKILLTSARKKEFNNLRKLDIGNVHTDCLLDLHQFVILQPQIQSVWIDSLHQHPPESTFINEEMIVPTAMALDNVPFLENFRMPLLFAVSELTKCPYLTRIVFDNLCDPEIYGKSVNSVSTMRQLFDGSTRFPKVQFFKVDLHGCTGLDANEILNLILTHFPSTKELIILGLHPNGLPAIWEKCLLLEKLQVWFHVTSYDFHLDESFTGFEMRSQSKEEEGAVGKSNGQTGISVLNRLVCLEVGCRLGANTSLKYWEKHESIRYKMTDVSFEKGISLIPGFKNFQLLGGCKFYGREDDNQACFEVSGSVLKTYIDSAFEINYWDHSLEQPNQWTSKGSGGFMKHLNYTKLAHRKY